MDPDGGVYKGMTIGLAHSDFEVGRIAGADGHHAFDAGRARAFDDGVAVGVKFFVVQVDVRIDQLHFRMPRLAEDVDTSAWATMVAVISDALLRGCLRGIPRAPACRR